MISFFKHDPKRPVDWRWQRAGEIAAQSDTAGPARNYDDEPVGTALKFRRALQRAPHDRERFRIRQLMPHAYEAWSLYNDTTDKHCKWELEARILAGQSYDTIPEHICVTPEAASIYEQWFFNVADRMHIPGYITHQVFGKSIQLGLAERHYDLLWKMFGYWGGPLVLDAVIYKFNAPVKPTTRAGVTAFWSDDANETTRVKGAIALRTMPIVPENQMEIANLFVQLQTLERNAGGGGGAAQEAMVANIKAFMDTLPSQWRKHNPDHRLPPATELERIDRDGTCLRATELMIVGASGLPAGLQELMESARFPERRALTHDNATAE